MAHAAVEKLKNLGLRHGEKAAVTLASVVFFTCLGLAATRETIQTTPDQIKSAAEQSDQNLNRQVPPDQLLEKIVEAGIVETNFLQKVEDQSKTLLAADDYRVQRPWVMPEPGAGLIRDTPVLIAVTELYAYPGRGGAMSWVLDEKGNRVLDDGKGELAKEHVGVRRRRGRIRGAMGSSRRGRHTRLSQADFEKEEEKRRLEEQKKIDQKLAGSVDPNAKTEQEREQEEFARQQALEGGPFKETLSGLRWVVLTGVLDHAKLVENYRAALKNPAVAHPFYKRLNLQRQVLQPDETWSDWADVATEKNLNVLDNITEGDDEMTPETVRPEALVDPLPFLRSGYWEKVHIASLVPKERREVVGTQLPGGGMFGMMDEDDDDMRGRGRGAMARGGGMMRGGPGGRPGPMSSAMFMEDDDDMRGGGMRGRGPRGYGGGAETIDYWKSDEAKVMVRALDFTVVPDTTYRYRVQIVVWNPNKGREDTSPGTDKTSIELLGPWSEPTDPVYFPADVSPYVLDSSPPTPRSDAKLRFQVIRFDPKSGTVVPRNFDYSPGEVVGEPATAQIPTSDGTGTKSSNLDFTSHQILLDILGEPTPLPSGIVGAPLDVPVVALMLRPDGALVIHNEADDDVNEVRKDMFANYQREIEESKNERQSSMGDGYRGRGGRGGGGRGRGGRGGRL